MQSNSLFSALIDIFIAPSKAFNALKTAKFWSFAPFILIVGLSGAAQLGYYYKADRDFAIEQQVSQAAKDASIGEEKMIRTAIEQGYDTNVWIAVFGGAIVIAVMCALLALYYLLISKMDENNTFKYGDWFGFSIWTTMPACISFLGALVLIFSASSTEIPLSVFNFGSINQLLLHLPVESPYYTIAERFTLITIWGIALGAIGLTCWTNFKFAKALLFAALPSVLIYGAWLAFV